MFQFPAQYPVACMAASGNGTWLVTGSAEPVPRVRIHDTLTGQVVKSFAGPKQAVRAVAVTPQRGRVLAVADDTVYVWDVDTGQLLRQVRVDGADCLAVSADGQWAMTGLRGGLYAFPVDDAKDGGIRCQLRQRVYGVAFGPDNSLAFVGGANGRVLLWDLQADQEVRRFPGHAGGVVTCLAVSAQGHRLLTGATDATVRLWDVDTGRELKKFSSRKGMPRALALAGDGTLAAAVFQVEGAAADVPVWDLATGKTLYRVEGHTGEVTGVVVVPARDRLITGGADQTLRVWALRPANLPNGEPK
jgi:WD40 repeat protein